MGNPKRLWHYYFESEEALATFERWLGERFPHPSRYERQLTQLMNEHEKLRHTSGRVVDEETAKANQILRSKLADMEGTITQLRRDGLIKEQTILELENRDPDTLSRETIRDRIEKALKDRKDNHYLTVERLWTYLGISRIDGEDTEKKANANAILLEMVDEGLVGFKVYRSTAGFRWVR